MRPRHPGKHVTSGRPNAAILLRHTHQVVQKIPRCPIPTAPTTGPTDEWPSRYKRSVMYTGPTVMPSENARVRLVFSPRERVPTRLAPPRKATLILDVNQDSVGPSEVSRGSQSVAKVVLLLLKHAGRVVTDYECRGEAGDLNRRPDQA